MLHCCRLEKVKGGRDGLVTACEMVQQLSGMLVGWRREGVWVGREASQESDECSGSISNWRKRCDGGRLVVVAVLSVSSMSAMAIVSALSSLPCVPECHLSWLTGSFVAPSTLVLFLLALVLAATVFDSLPLRVRRVGLWTISLHHFL